MLMLEDNNDILCCPKCYSSIKQYDNSLKCENPNCNTSYPILNSIPILINDDESLFPIEFFVQGSDTTFKSGSKYKRIGKKYLPKISLNLKSKENFECLRDLLLVRNKNPKVLVIGGSILGDGMEALTSEPTIEFIESDVSFGPRTKVILDAHNIPFKDKSFDAVIVQAVLEHVLDPNKVVEEIYRVLNDGGLVYSETPFMQQVHMGEYDFTRFTFLGHRYLFKQFKEIDIGVIGGPGMAFAWSYQYFLLSFVKSSYAKNFVLVFSRITAFWLKYFDKYLADKPGAYDAASGYYFLGEKSNEEIPDKELIKMYRGFM